MFYLFFMYVILNPPLCKHSVWSFGVGKGTLMATTAAQVIRRAQKNPKTDNAVQSYPIQYE
jgi:hypothetical protein